MKSSTNITARLEQIYTWLDEAISDKNVGCNACGRCCDFKAFGHSLFVTSAELIYLTEKLETEKLKPMPAERCPYQVDDKCSIYNYRFCGCRIFACKGDEDFQTQLSEHISQKLKALCDELNISYRYTNLKTALNRQ